jgi:HAMP domain-containing protein
MLQENAGVDPKVRFWDSVLVRLVSGVLVLTMAAGALVWLIVALQHERQFTEQHASTAKAASLLIANDLSNYMLAGDSAEVWNAISAQAAQHSDTTGVLRLLVFTGGGTIKAGTDSDAIGSRMEVKDNPQCPACDSTWAEDFPAVATFSTPDGARRMRIISRVPVTQACMLCHKSEESARSFVSVDFDMAPLERAGVERRRDILGMGLVSSIMLAALITLLFRRWVMRPVKSLMASMDRLASGELGERTEVLGRNELAVLARNFNHMAEQIEDQVARIDAASTESELLYTLVVWASRRLETSEVADSVSRVMREELHPRHVAFFLETADGGWVCATGVEGQEEALASGKGALEEALASGTAPLQRLLGDFPLALVADACRKQELQRVLEAGEVKFALPVAADERFVGLLLCAGIPAKLHVGEGFLINLGAHLSLVAANSRHYTGAITDSLTQLKNKGYGLARLEEAVLAARRNK